MKILLAGYNIDSDVIEDLKKNSPGREDITPETLSAAYARISRDPRTIDQLREAARAEVSKTRKSNKAIIFKMGHHSVAEHAVFNFDILGVSRLAIEALERFRLCSYTEKSQRYITLDNDYVVPIEIQNADFEISFRKMIEEQNKMYHLLYGKLKEHVFSKNAELAKDPKKHNLLEGWAKEDARYITSLATQGQLGHTINARNLELLLRRFASNNLSEVRDIGKELYSLVAKVAPSIILFHQANDYDQKSYIKLEELDLIKNLEQKSENKEVMLVDYTKNADNTVVAALLYKTTSLSFPECVKKAEQLSSDEKVSLVKTVLEDMEFYDTLPREYEYANLTYDISISAACFGQLKRHRMSSICEKEYDPSLGVTVPEAIKEIGLEKQFMEVIEKTEDLYSKIYEKLPQVAPYILTNAHRRRVLFACNARELYHVSRLREDTHAQWDIRNISKEMSEEAKKVMPITMLLIGGKDKYPEIYKGVYGKFPKIVEVTL